MTFRPLLIRPGGPLTFPSPLRAEREGLVAVGGDLAPERLLHAYERGIFPWYDSDLPLWWSPDPRAIMTRTELHVSRSLSRFMRKSTWRVSFDEAFRRVMQECARDRTDGTWIHPEMVEAYSALAERGHAHSFEVWDGEALVGGLYGVQRGALFAAESMFHRSANASKVALATALSLLFESGISVFDVQFVTEHLASLGAFEVPRADYLARVEQASPVPVSLASLRGKNLLPQAVALLSAPLP